MEIDESFFRNVSNIGYDKSKFIILRPHDIKDLVEGIEDK